MAKTLVTGGSGFVGSHLVKALSERGDELRLLSRRAANLEILDGLDFERVTGDVTDRRSVRRAMSGVDRVFHVAGSTSMRPEARQRVFETNVMGARIVAEEALGEGVGRFVHTSSASAIGPARPSKAADESQAFNAGNLGIAYVNSKHESELEVLRVAAHGLDVVIVNPTFVLGPEDPSGTSNGLLKRVMLRQIPFYVEGGLNVVDVRDVARGHLLADSKGEPGERYILGGRNFSLPRLFADIGRIAGVPPPPIQVPLHLTRAAAEAGRRTGIATGVTDEEIVSAGQWWTYRSGKAKRELGFSARPHEETLEDAVAWQAERLGDRVGSAPRGDIAMQVFGRVLALGHRVGLG